MVRCLTRRFLPEYAKGCDECHTFQTMIDGENVRMEIIDSSKNVSIFKVKKQGFLEYKKTLNSSFKELD